MVKINPTLLQVWRLELPAVEHLHPEVFPEHLAPDGDAPVEIVCTRVLDDLLLLVPLEEVPGDQFLAVGRVQLQQGLHLEQSLILGELVAVEKVDQDLQDVQQRLEVGRGLRALDAW